MGDVIGSLAVFAVVIGVGFFAATPALLIGTLADTDLSAVASAGTLAALAAEVLAILSAWLLHRLILHRTMAEATIGALASGYVNAANLGIPVLVLVRGDATPIAPVLLLQLLVITPATFAILDAVTRRGSPSRLATFTIPVRNPLLLAVVAGVAVNLGGVDLDGIAGGRLREIISTLGRIAVPLMMLSLGMSLAASRLRAPSGEGAPAPPPEPVHNAAGDRGSGRIRPGAARAGPPRPRHHRLPPDGSERLHVRLALRRGQAAGPRRRAADDRRIRTDHPDRRRGAGVSEMECAGRIGRATRRACRWRSTYRLRA